MQSSWRYLGLDKLVYRGQGKLPDEEIVSGRSFMSPNPFEQAYIPRTHRNLVIFDIAQQIVQVLDEGAEKIWASGRYVDKVCVWRSPFQTFRVEFHVEKEGEVRLEQAQGSEGLDESFDSEDRDLPGAEA